ncbi:UDP-glycosyltransferase UGT4-like [Musca autumnalis]|uniref:UDP-glycosyltransferase UGT4-like n=1 Tax=Musca autumnalis TaxID=221902 RepID=UPI003CEBCCA6
MKRKVNIISILFVLLAIAVIPNESARILSIFPSPSLSHLFIHFSVAETLAKDGHNVTVIATAPNPYKNPDIKYIYLKEPMFDAEFARKMVNKPSPIYVKLAHNFGLVLDMTNNTLNNPLMQQFLRDHKAGDFDLVLLGYGMNDFIFGLGAHFQCPMVLSFMVQSVFTTNSMVGNPAEAAYVPTLFAEQKQPMDFPARVKNFLSSLYENVIFKEMLSRKSQRYYR